MKDTIIKLFPLKTLFFWQLNSVLKQRTHHDLCLLLDVSSSDPPIQPKLCYNSDLTYSCLLDNKKCDQKLTLTSNKVLHVSILS